MSDKTRMNAQTRASLVSAPDTQPVFQRRARHHDPHAQLRQNAAFMAQMKVQRKANGAGEEDTQATLAAAAQGVRGSGGALPYLETIQKSFGHHNVTGVQAFVGGQAKTASEAIGAEAYASGNAVAFRESPTLHTAAHEAAHIVQQRYGVQLQGGVGQVGDKYEVHADAVADRVVQGKDASDLLDSFVGQKAPGSGVQRKAVQRRPAKYASPSSGRDTHPMPGTERPRVRRRRLGVFRFAGQVILDGVKVRARTVEGWKTFLTHLADEPDGSIELAAFLGRALRYTHLPISHENSLKGLTPVTRRESLALMEALLTVGGDIDLADKSFEQPDEERAARRAIVAKTGALLANFNASFSAECLTRLSFAKGQLSKDFAGRVSAYAEDAADMRAYGESVEGRPGPDPVQRLVASALGTAIGAISNLLAAKRDRTKVFAFDQVANGAKTIKGCLDQIQADNATSKSILMTVFKTAVGVAGAMSGGTGALALSLFSPVAEEFFGACLKGDGEEARGKLIDDFVAAVRRLEVSGRLISDDGRLLKLTFEQHVQ